MGPETGGVVRIPPGTFEVAEPLIIGKSDVTIEDVTVVGNLFAGLRPKALTVTGRPSPAVLFSGNILADAEHDCSKLDKSLVNNNLGLEK